MLNAKVIRRSLKRWPEKLEAVNREFLPEAGKIVRGQAKRMVPVDDGPLRASIKDRREGHQSIVYSNMEYAPHVEYGTRPHWIGSPVKIKGKWRYIGQHPGTLAQPFMRPAIDKNRRALTRLWLQIYRKVYGR